MHEFQESQPMLITILIPAARVAEREMAEALVPLGLAPAQFAIIDLLDRNGELRPAVIARSLAVETSTMTANLQRAERDGFVTRKSDPTDSRSILMSLSQLGRERVPQARVALQAVEYRLTEGLAADQKEALQAAMRQIVRGRG